MFKNLKMGTKIGLGFALVTVVLVIVAVVTLVQVTQNNTVTNELLQQDQPIAEASLRLLNSVNESAASLRGWMLLGDEKFKLNRADAWTNQIDPALNRLKSLVTRADSARIDNVAALEGKKVEELTPYEKIALVEFKLGELKKYQEKIEAVSQTDDNIPAYKLLLTDAAPKAAQIVSNVTAIIDEEATLEASAERKNLLINLANFRGSITMGLANIRAYLLSGDDTFRDEFDKQWLVNQSAFENIEADVALLMGKQATAWQTLKKNRTAFEPLPEKMFELRKSKNWNVANAGLQDDAGPRALVIRETLEALLAKDLRPQVERKQNDVLRRTATLKYTVWALLIAGVVASVLSGVLITLSITRPVKRVLADIKQMTGELGTTVQEINSATQEQVATMTEAASSVNEITATSEEFKATIQEFADRARAVREAAEETAQRAAEGLDLTQSTSSKNDEVRLSFEAAGESIFKLSEQMQQITQITISVNEIAEQTKLLALNASIEAARAGEEGRGFAVVATQVRELANQSKEASSRIASQIAEIQTSVQTVIRNSEQGSEKLNEASHMGLQMAQAFQQIAHAIAQTTDAMKQIDQAAGQQELGISDLVTGITEINTGSRETLASAEQTQKAIAAIEQRAKNLSENMGRFQKTV